MRSLSTSIALSRGRIDNLSVVHAHTPTTGTPSLQQDGVTPPDIPHLADALAAPDLPKATRFVHGQTGGVLREDTDL